MDLVEDKRLLKKFTFLQFLALIYQFSKSNRKQSNYILYDGFKEIGN